MRAEYEISLYIYHVCVHRSAREQQVHLFPYHLNCSGYSNWKIQVSYLNSFFCSTDSIGNNLHFFLKTCVFEFNISPDVCISGFKLN